jgi:hypothetical protein
MNGSGLPGAEQERSVQALVDAVQQATSASATARPRRWRTTVDGIDVALATEDDWLLASTPLRAVPEDGHGRLLWLNGALPAAMKIALAPDNGEPQLRAELFLDKEVDLSSRLPPLLLRLLGPRTATQSCASEWHPEVDWPLILRSLLHVSSGTELVDGAGLLAQPLPPAAPAQSAGEYAVELCREAGWPAVLRANGDVAVELEVTGGFYQAIIASCACGMRSYVDLSPPPEPLSFVCRQSRDLLLLRATGLVRLVRGVAKSTAADAPVRLEVAFDQLPSALEVGHALAALSVACGLCAAELEIIQRDEAVACELIELAARFAVAPQTPQPLSAGPMNGSFENRALAP